MTALDRAFVKAYLPQRHLIRRGSAAGTESAPPTTTRVASVAPPPAILSPSVVAAPSVEKAQPTQSVQAQPFVAPVAAPHCQPEVIEPTFTLQLAPIEEPVLAEVVSEEPAEIDLIISSAETPSAERPSTLEHSTATPSTTPHSTATQNIATQSTEMLSTTTMQPLSAFAPAGEVEEQFHARLEVDQFSWPEPVTRLSESAARELGGFVEQLASRSYRGERLFNLMGMHRGVGCTTVLLAAARELAGRRLRTAIVDAKFSGPILAPRLGIASGGGWEQVCGGSAPLEEIMISSVDDAMTLVPLADSASPSMLKLGALHVSVMFGLLRDHFDIVLVDAGTMDELGDACQISACGTTAQPDGVFLVYDRRSTQEATIAEACRRLASVRMDVLGRVENFAQRELPAPKLSIVG
jgi:Mrp family chromosome partitioning ATPase